MFKKLSKQLKEGNTAKALNGSATSPFESLKSQARTSFLKSLSKHALNLYERKTDINNFTRIALSDPENTSHNDIVDELFSKDGIVNPYGEEALFELSENKKFLEDLGLQ